MQCCFCGKYAEDIEEAIDDGWYPDFWHLEINYQGPICPDCQCEHLETDKDGEFVLKEGHVLPSSADPMVSRTNPTSAPITCLFCGKTVEGIEPFCTACKLEHFTLNEAGEEVLKPGHEIPSFPLFALNDPPNPQTRPKFELGQVVGTPAALEAISAAGQTPDFFLDKHVRGDWGELGIEDKLANDQAVVTGERILSAYRTLLGVRIWIITEAKDDQGKRAASTIILPEEY
jgi:hypothetical protein